MVDEVKVNYETIQESCTKKYFSSWCSFFGYFYIYIYMVTDPPVIYLLLPQNVAHNISNILNLSNISNISNIYNISNISNLSNI